jgi:hypothetical protein
VFGWEAENMKQSKKGISLAFVIVVVMALMIFSAMLFSAASHSLSMTGTSTEGRQAYLTAKSAIEYAKTLAYDKAKSGGKLVPFSVGHDADGNYAELAAATAPNGTDCYAECTNPGGDGKNWKILAKVKYQNSGQYRQLAYTFTLNWNASVSLPASDFLACGVNYGSSTVLQNIGGGWTPAFFSTNDIADPSKGRSVYPVVENATTYAYLYKNSAGMKLNDYVSAPEILFMGPTDSTHDTIFCYNVPTEIHSNFIAIADNITGCAYYMDDKSFLYFYPSDSTAPTGVVYFGGRSGGTCSVNVNGTAILKISAGYYQYDAGIDLFSLKKDGDNFVNTAGKGLRKLTQTEQQDGSVKRFSADLASAQSNAPALLSGDSWSDSSRNTAFKGADIAPYGVFASGSRDVKRGNDWYGNNTNYKMNEKIVYTYANSVRWPFVSSWPQYLDPYGNMIDTNDGTHPNAKKYIIYAAKQFFLRFVSRSEDFKLPPTSDVYNVAFNSDLVSLSMAVSDTDAGADADHRPKIVQANDAPSSQFLLTSLSTDENGNHKDVTLVIPNSIDVLYQNGSKSYHIPQGVYQVKSGFNFFDNDVENWTKFWSDCKKANYPISDSGDSGGSGGFTISGGKYADS